MSPPSDPYDDFDDLFNDPTALASLAAIEEKAIAASQAPQAQRKNHHTIARPAAGPRAAPVLHAPVPRPLNTNPRVTGCGFGWETGGKHLTRAEQRPIPQPPKKEPLFLPRPSSFDDDPVDVMLNDKGQYGLAGPAPPSLAPKPLQRTRSISTEPKGMPLPGSQARREAIEAARGNNNTPGDRGPLARSTSSTSTGGIPNPKPTNLGTTRGLARSVSIGQQVFPRANAGGGFSRGMPLGGGLAPISSQGSEASSSQGAGAAARRVAVELEEERRLRERTELELRELRQRLAESEAVVEGDDMTKLRQDLFAANGQAKMVRENAKIAENKFKDEIKQLREANQDLEQRMKDKELESKQKVESMRTQAVFSNHHALASASKARQQSQFMASQWQATPMKMGSPLKNKTLVTPAPLIHSVKGKGRADAPPPPRFDGLTNAFNMTPTVSRTKRQRTEALSPVTTPKKQRSGSRPPSPIVISPLASPAQSQHLSQQQSQHAVDIDLAIDWQPDFGEASLPQEDITVPEPPRDHKTELVHHILTHHALSPGFDLGDEYDRTTTLVRISRNPLGEMFEGLRPWDVLAQALLSVCSDLSQGFDDSSTVIMTIFAEMLAVTRSFDYNRPDETMPWEEWIPRWFSNTIWAMRLIASTILLFPSLVASNLEAANDISNSIYVVTRVIAPAFREASQNHHAFGVEMADAIVELGEALCLADAKRIWMADQLSVLLLNLMQSDVPAVVARGLDLFVVASCYQDNFQSIVFPSEELALDVPVIDRVSRFLAHGHPKFTPEQFAQSSLAALGALFTLSKQDPDAIVLLAGHSMLVPSLLLVLHRESTRLWGVRAHNTATHNPLELLLPALILLHHLVYPAPNPRSFSTSQPTADDIEATLFKGTTPQGVDLRRRLHETGSTNEFNGVQHVFVTALGTMAYAEVDVAMVEQVNHNKGKAKYDPTVDLRTVQYLAQDLLDHVVEGPEGDQVFELYATEEQPEQEVIDVEEEYGEDYGEEELILGAGAEF